MYLTIKMKKQVYIGRNVIAIYMNDVTQKIYGKLNRMKLQETYIKEVQTESFTSTMSHEMRTPLLSCIFFIQQLLVALESMKE